MTITINGNGTVTGVSVGGLPDGIVDNDMIANTTIAEGKLAASVNTITQADQWRINADFATANASGITSNWERNDNNFSVIGSGMSETSGRFTFPETGIWRIDFNAIATGSAEIRYIVSEILYTADDWSSSGSLGFANGSISNDTNANYTASCSAIFDVTNVSTHHVQMTVYAESSMTWAGNSTQNATYATFIRLGDT